MPPPPPSSSSCRRCCCCCTTLLFPPFHTGLLCYMLLLSGRSPSKILFTRGSGRVFQLDLLPLYGDKGTVERIEVVPYRLTRNLATFFTAFGVEVRTGWGLTPWEGRHPPPSCAFLSLAVFRTSLRHAKDCVPETCLFMKRTRGAQAHWLATHTDGRCLASIAIQGPKLLLPPVNLRLVHLLPPGHTMLLDLILLTLTAAENFSLKHSADAT